MKTKFRKRRRARKSSGRLGRPACRVLTLPEAAAYLRVSENAVLKMTAEQGLPGRQIGSEWRFLQSALDAWLCTPPNEKNNREVLLDLAGRWKDDPYLDELMNHIYESRGRVGGST